MAARRIRTIVIALVGAVVAAAVLWTLAARDDDLPWVVWKLEGTVERGATPLPVLGVAAEPGGEAIDGEWVVRRGTAVYTAGGKLMTIWERLQRPRRFAEFWDWLGRRTGRSWLSLDGAYAEFGRTVTTSGGRWRQFLRAPLPGDTWHQRPDPALAGRWRGHFVESGPEGSSDLVFHEDGTIEGLRCPPGSWGVRENVLVVTWGEGTQGFTSWQGCRTGPAEFESFRAGHLMRESP